MSDIETNKERMVLQRLSGEENKWLIGWGIGEALGKRKRYGETSTRAPTLKQALYCKIECRFMAVTKMNATFNKASIFNFCVYNSRSSSTYATGKFDSHFK